MSTDFVSIASYLDGDDVQVVRKKLDSSGILYIVVKGSNDYYYSGEYYQVKVDPKHFSAAKGIINSLRAENFIRSRKCPKCGSMVNEPVTGLNIFQKLLYLGTTPVRCKKCKTKFVI
jgi:hypothetical protein